MEHDLTTGDSFKSGLLSQTWAWNVVVAEELEGSVALKVM
jgi:hypothetical protein